MEVQEEEGKVKCPKCGSTQITANKKGFSIGKAAVGAVLTGGIGLLAGGIGAGNIRLTCLRCGNTWKPRVNKTIQEKIDEQDKKLGQIGSLKNKNGDINAAGCLVIFAVVLVLYLLFR